MEDDSSPWWTTLATRLAAIDPAFAGEIDRLAEEQVDLIERVLRLQPGDRVLDLGCGAGRHTCLLQERGLDMTGLDLAPAVLELARGNWARRHGDRPGPRWVQGDMRQPPLQGPFDAILSMDAAFGVFREDAEHLAVLDALAGLLRPGGRLLLEVVNPFYWAANPATRYLPPGTLTADAHLVRTTRFHAETGRLEDQLLRFGRGPEPERLPCQSLRAWTPTELRGLLGAAGFPEIAFFGLDGWRVPTDPIPLDAARSPFIWVRARAA